MKEEDGCVYVRVGGGCDCSSDVAGLPLLLFFLDIVLNTGAPCPSHKPTCLPDESIFD
jgi:hypothetical protein